MLSNIKSSYFSEIIFSYIYERKKLKLVKYNKSLQKNINISIINYKFYSGKYIIYETNNIGKEYYGSSDILLYLNGERNGKGKAYNYWDGIVYYYGEYLNGKRNGKGQEYYRDGKLEFEGEYLNGKKMEKEKNILEMVN